MRVQDGNTLQRVGASEYLVHRAVVAHLSSYGAQDAIVWHTPNGGTRNIVEARKFKAMGVRAGIPDLMIYRGKQLYALELKSDKGGKVSREQVACMKRLTEEGALCAVARGVDEALSVLDEWGLLTRKARK